jgi:pentatricopeptide repeat protein
VETIKNASSLFRKHCREKESYNSYGTLIHIYVNQGRLAEASHLIAEYESQSNCFDQSGNISKGREIY